MQTQAVEADLLEGLDPLPTVARYATPAEVRRLRAEVFARTSLAELGPKVGLSPSGLSRKLNGATRLTRLQAHAIVEALRVGAAEGGVR